MSDEQLARGVALGVVIIFGIAAGISYVEPARPIPDPFYPPFIMALGYLLGVRVMRNGKGE